MTELFISVLSIHAIFSSAIIPPFSAADIAPPIFLGENQMFFIAEPELALYQQWYGLVAERPP